MSEEKQTKSILAALQMNSSDNVQENLATVDRLMKQASEQGAQLVLLPEVFAYMGEYATQINEVAETLASSFPIDKDAAPIQAFLSDCAQRHSCWVVAGTLPIIEASDTTVADAEKPYACSIVFNAQGEIVAHYNKIHLFQSRLDAGELYDEAQQYKWGDEVTVVSTPFGRIGLSVCYDLRFPLLYQRMVEQGVDIITMPAAFTDSTGRPHWQPLLQARAIESLSYVLAADQYGQHANGRQTHGHSMTLDYWGRIEQRLPTGEGVVLLHVDLDELTHVRQHFPALDNRKQL